MPSFPGHSSLPRPLLSSFPSPLFSSSHSTLQNLHFAFISTSLFRPRFTYSRRQPTSQRALELSAGFLHTLTFRFHYSALHPSPAPTAVRRHREPLCLQLCNSVTLSVSLCTPLLCSGDHSQRRADRCFNSTADLLHAQRLPCIHRLPPWPIRIDPVECSAALRYSRYQTNADRYGDNKRLSISCSRLHRPSAFQV